MKNLFLQILAALCLMLTLGGCSSSEMRPSSEDPEVKRLIEAVKLPLPDSYIRFLENPEKFIPDSTTIDLCSVDKNYVGEWMCPFPVDIEAWDNPASALEAWGYTEDLFRKKALFPIAEILGGEVLLIGFGETNHGEVWFWSGDFDYLKLSDSLEEFLLLLR